MLGVAENTRKSNIKVKGVSAVTEVYTRYNGRSNVLVLFGEEGRPERLRNA